MSSIRWTSLVVASLVSLPTSHAFLRPRKEQGGGSKGDAQQAKGAGQSHGGQQGPSTADMEVEEFHHYLYAALAAIVFVVFCYRFTIFANRYIRTVACLNNDKQAYFAMPNNTWTAIRKHFIYAPLGRNRHNQELKLSAAVNMGTLPTRIQSLFLLAYIVLNAVFCLISIHWGEGEKVWLAEIRNRTGILAVVNMVPLFLMASRNNPFIWLLQIDFDTFNLIHRWLGRTVVLESVIHTVAYTISKVKTAGWTAVGHSIGKHGFIFGGLLGTLGFVILLLHSPSLIRHAFYETFLHVHIALVLLSVAGLWIHLKDLPQFKYLICVIVIWMAERGFRTLLIIYRNCGRGGTQAVVEALPGDALRVTISMARPWTFRPGQHLYLYMPSLGLWTSHPFSVAWSQEGEQEMSEKVLELDRHEALQMRNTTMALVIRRRTGFTDKLFQKAQNSVNGTVTLNAFVEGPYGGIENLKSYGTVMLFAAGVGITHQVPHVRDLVVGFSNNTVAARKVVLVWIIQSPEHLEWIRPYMTEVLSLPRRREVLRVLLFVTRPRSTAEIRSPSATVQMHPGRPNVETLVRMESENQVGAMGVSVCGTGSLSDDVRRAVRMRQDKEVEYVEQSFSW
ncbi:MAG: hypothetical protein M1833_000606 [Piccolia ochrophora]|nr:MAG: hypothetical protein M1833_000606 [Piccolia ochrophora]